MKNVTGMQLVWSRLRIRVQANKVQADKFAVMRLSPSEGAIATLSFEFPAHGHDFKGGKVYIHGREESWRLCRYPPCRMCLASPDAFILHMECFRILRRVAEKRTQGQEVEDTGTWIYDTLWQI